jgi:hypothetical protein
VRGKRWVWRGSDASAGKSRSCPRIRHARRGPICLKEIAASHGVELMSLDEVCATAIT